ncbi:MAG: hypothetical protein WC262_12645 [Bacteroidales bacterium]|jgi:uncharacterized membrane protein YeaQ/YmgE (transglycosylase-associated protein family)
MTDKILHFMAGAFISVVVGYLTRMPILGFLVACVIGLIKEFWDIEHGTAEFLDFVATALGAFLVLLILKYLGGF